MQETTHKQRMQVHLGREIEPFAEGQSENLCVQWEERYIDIELYWCKKG